MVGSTVPATGPAAAAIPARLRGALQRAQAAERTATGAARVPSFRLTRALIGGARVGGYPLADIANCLGVTTSSVRARGGTDGWIPTDVFAALTDLSSDDVRRWLENGVVVSTALDDAQRTCCRASELIRALVALGG